MDYVIVRYTGILIGNGQILCQWALTHNIGNFKCQRNFTAQKYGIFSCKSKSDSTCWFKINFHIESMKSIYFALCGCVDPYMLSCCVTKRGETKNCLTRSKCKRVFIHKSNPFVNFLYSHINNVFLIIPEKKTLKNWKSKLKKLNFNSVLHVRTIHWINYTLKTKLH